jgi:hypothetical protein
MHTSKVTFSEPQVTAGADASARQYGTKLTSVQLSGQHAGGLKRGCRFPVVSVDCDDFVGWALITAPRPRRVMARDKDLKLSIVEDWMMYKSSDTKIRRCFDNLL